MSQSDTAQNVVASSSDLANPNAAVIAAFSSAQAKLAGPPTRVATSVSLQTENRPLTTVFTPPSSCFKPSQWLSSPNTWSGGITAFGVNIVDVPQCYPSGLSEYTTDNTVWFSPGVCPESWNYLATMTRVTGGSTITSAYCCPPGILSGALGQAGGTIYTCWHNFDQGHTIFFGRPLNVAWEASDLDSFSPASAPLIALKRQGVGATTSTPSSTRQSPLTPPASPSSNGSPTGTANQSSTHSPSSGLSTGAAAGIGVGATVAGLAIFGLLLWFLRKRFKVSRREPPQYTKAELDGKTHFQAPPQELHDRQRANELHGTHVGELDSGYEGVEAAKGRQSPIEMEHA